MDETPINELFTLVDWFVVFGYLALTTWVGHRMRGKQASIRDFFLGGRSLPWPAVSGSIIATEISGVTFIGAPGTLFALNGDFTYLQWAIGSIFARILVGVYFTKVYYEREIYSPYDYMGYRLGSSAKILTTVLFTIGSILAQSVRVLVAAIPLYVVTGLPMGWCIVIIGIFAIGWTLMGGMQTVIWTDVMQFVLFTFGGLVAFLWIVFSLDNGVGEFWTTADEYGRLKLWDLRLQDSLQFTLWVAIFAVPFQNLGIFGTDQLMAQRMFCCKDAGAARKAIVYSSFGQILTLLMLLVGSALFVHYQKNGFTDRELAVVAELDATEFPAGSDEEAAELNRIRSESPLLHRHPKTDIPDGQLAMLYEVDLATAGAAERLEEIREARPPFKLTAAQREELGQDSPVLVGQAVSNVTVAGNHDFVFPVWIVKWLPVGLSGLILAGVFAAAISSLDSILAALSQTTLSLIYHPERGNLALSEAQLLNRSRMLVVMWGIILTLFTFGLMEVKDAGIPILPLAFGMTTYTVGPILAIFLAAMTGHGKMRGLVIGAVISFILVLFCRMDVWVLLFKIEGVTEWLPALLAKLPSYDLNAAADGVSTTFSYVWLWPITTVLTFVCGLIFGGKARPESE